MATVRISQDLISGVSRNLRRMYDKRIDAKKCTKESDSPLESQGVYDFFMGDYLPNMQALPDSFYRKTNEFVFELETFISAYTNLYISLKFNSPRSVANVFEHAVIAKQRWTYDSSSISFTLKDVDYSNTGLAPIVDKLRSVISIEEQKNRANDQVKALLKKYSTLSPALKEFPALWDLLDSEYKDRHKEVVEKKVKSDAEPSVEVIDLSSIGAAIIANKLGV